MNCYYIVCIKDIIVHDIGYLKFEHIATTHDALKILESY